MDEIIGTLMWRINDEAEGRIVNATINVLDRVHKQYLTMCQTEVTTKNIEFSFLINRLMVKCFIPASAGIKTFISRDIFLNRFAPRLQQLHTSKALRD